MSPGTNQTPTKDKTMNAAYKAGYKDGIDSQANQTNRFTCHDVHDYQRGYEDGQADAREIEQRFPALAAR